jgi:Zn-dependent protease with chaperone function
MVRVIALALVGVALVLAGPVPRLMAGHQVLRRSPRAALVAWQAVSLAAVLAALAAAPAAIPLVLHDDRAHEHVGLLGLVGAVSGLILARLLVEGHRIGVRIRAARSEHRELVDIIAKHQDDRLRVLALDALTAYCLPGRRSRVVLSAGTLASLPPDQLGAVMAHERAHLRGRHDLLLEYFTVLHHAVPAPVRCEAALREVQFLVEVLADRASVRTVGEVPTARALVALAEARVPEAALGLAPVSSSASERIALLAAGRPHPVLPAVLYAVGLFVLVVPVLLISSTLIWALQR